MVYRRRIYFTEKQKAEIWDRWQRGESMSSIGRLFDRNSSSIYPLLARTGGIRPPERRRSRLAMTLAEREEVSRSLRAGLSLRCIARQLRRAPSTISREVRRNGGRRVYRAANADQAAWDRARRPKPCKLANRPALCQTIAEKLARKWSPQQLAGWLKREHPDDEGARVSHETIYRSLFIQARGVLKKELLATRTIRRSRHASLKRDGLGQIKDAISIRERPSAVEDRAIPGHWEGDLIAGSKNNFIATLVERRTRYVMLAKVSGKETQTVVAALAAQVRHLPRELRLSLIWDRRKELADHKSLTLTTDLDIYFCDPHSPWQRGTNENTNRLLRQYFPKGTDLSVHTQEHLDAVARELNERPRMTLNYFSPAEKFDECVAAIG
ncbi:MAG: IS30 family transposase [Paracoccaceae bacterium]|nr:IS30 family transposase [Paracoccaceae bacterium]